MSGWGISEKEKIKSKFADYLNGLNCCGDINYTVYCDLFDNVMELFDEMYELGKTEKDV